VDGNLCKDIWGMPYKIVMQKIKTKGVMNTLKKRRWKVYNELAANHGANLY